MAKRFLETAQWVRTLSHAERGATGGLAAVAGSSVPLPHEGIDSAAASTLRSFDTELAALQEQVRPW